MLFSCSPTALRLKKKRRLFIPRDRTSASDFVALVLQEASSSFDSMVRVGSVTPPEQHVDSTRPEA